MKCENCKHWDNEAGICGIENFHKAPKLRCLTLHIIWLLRTEELERQDERDAGEEWKNG